MSILKIARMGHPVLRSPATPVDDPQAPEIARLVADMTETLADIGGVGLAAPQVHVPLRVVIFFVPETRLTPRPLDRPRPLTALINPVIEPLSDEQGLGWEGCLSVPGLRGAAPRWTHIRYRATGLAGETIDIEAQGYHARIVQHECDHLDGILYPMRMTDLGLLSFVEESARYPVDLDDYAAAQ